MVEHIDDFAAVQVAARHAEPTASLDPRAEHDLFSYIRTLYKGRTVLLISHRYNTVRDADHIYVLDRGRIIERRPLKRPRHAHTHRRR
jgi:ABC-type multidrug transport system fused ATPase/permease subunit